MLEFRSGSRAVTVAVGELLGRRAQPGDVVVLCGELGGGKTAFASGIARGLGSDDPVTSPTFAIVQEYEGRIGIVHADFYRLKTVQELYDLGFDDVFDGERVVLVEWGDRAMEVLTSNVLRVSFAHGASADERTITFEDIGGTWGERWPALKESVECLATAFPEHC